MFLSFCIQRIRMVNLKKSGYFVLYSHTLHHLFYILFSIILLTECIVKICICNFFACSRRTRKKSSVINLRFFLWTLCGHSQLLVVKCASLSIYIFLCTINFFLKNANCQSGVHVTRKLRIQ